MNPHRRQALWVLGGIAVAGVLVAGYLVVSLGIGAARRHTPVHRTVQVGERISQFGEFDYPALGLVLKIRVKDSSLIDFELVDRNSSRVLVRPEHLASDIGRWHLEVREDGSLVYATSDIGDTVWRRGSSGEYQIDVSGRP